MNWNSTGSTPTQSEPMKTQTRVAQSRSASAAAEPAIDALRAGDEQNGFDISRVLGTQTTRKTSAHRARMLVSADVLSFLLVTISSFFLGLCSRWLILGIIRHPELSDAQRLATMFVPALIILVWRSWSLGHYTQFRPVWPEVQEVIKTVLLIAAFDAFILFVMGNHFSRLWFGFFLIELCLFVPYGRYLAKRAMIKRGTWYTPTYIVGTGENARNTAYAIESDPSLGHQVVGFIDLAAVQDVGDQVDGKEIYQSLPPLEKQPSGGDQPSLVFAFETLDELNAHRATLNEYIASSAFVSVAPPPLGLPLYGAKVVGIFRHDTSLLKLQNNLNNSKSRLTKRATDLVGGVLCFVLLSPVFLLISLLIARDGGSVVYKHRRIGADGREFDCYKFRSMVTDSDAALAAHLAANPSAEQEWLASRKLKDDPRVTRIGRYLRKTSLDELPQLWNVMRGEMSLVGPRPIVREESELYEEYLPYYLTMTPGMTGLWQVSGRTDTSYNERIRLDVWYSRNWSLWNDLVILVQTVQTLIKRHGAY